MLTKNFKIKKIEYDELKTIFVEEVTEILEDDVLISSNTHRTSYAPSTDINSITQLEAKSLAQFLWTEEVKLAYQSHIDALNSQTI